MPPQTIYVTFANEKPGRVLLRFGYPRQSVGSRLEQHTTAFVSRAPSRMLGVLPLSHKAAPPPRSKAFSLETHRAIAAFKWPESSQQTTPLLGIKSWGLRRLIQKPGAEMTRKRTKRRWCGCITHMQARLAIRIQPCASTPIDSTRGWGTMNDLKARLTAHHCLFGQSVRLDRRSPDGPTFYRCQ